MHLLMIFNPNAGNRRSQKIIEAAKEFFVGKNIEAVWMFTSYPGHAREIVAGTHLDQFDGVVAAGGDGTLFEVLNGLYDNRRPKKPALGVLPTGTGNAFARELDLFTSDWQQALDIIAAGKTKEVDVGKFNSDGQSWHFINILGFGFVADVNATSRGLKYLGNFSYILGVFYQLLFLKHYTLKIKADDQEFERENVFVEISNTRYTGKTFLMAPQAKIDDGKLDVVLLNKVTRRRILQLFPKIFTGKHVEEPEVETLRASHLEISTNRPCILTPDGELFGSTPITVDVLPNDVRVFWK